MYSVFLSWVFLVVGIGAAGYAIWIIWKFRVTGENQAVIILLVLAGWLGMYITYKLLQAHEQIVRIQAMTPL